MKRLEETYKQLQSILGTDIESFDAVKLVHEYRQYWKPEKVKVLLLAESHVFTTARDMKMNFPTTLPSYPTSYAKFVYCLAYGEKDLTGNPHHPKRDGTPQFWKIFYACANRVSVKTDFLPVLKRTPYHQRISNKIALLETLKRMGVWLVDTSIVALYPKPDRRRLSRALKCSWQCYTFDLVKKCAPAYVICVGKGIGDVVDSSLRSFVDGNYTVLPQPNARLDTRDHMKAFQSYHRICENIRWI